MRNVPSLLAFVLSAAIPALADEIHGRVDFIKEREVRIRLLGELAPSAGDRLDLFKREMDDWGPPEICAHGIVLTVQEDFVLARIEGQPANPLERGQRVTFHSDKPQPLDAESKKHDPLGGTPPTREQAQPFIEKLEREAAEGRLDSFREAFDMDALQARALDNSKLSGPMRNILTWMFDGLVDNVPNMAWCTFPARPSACRLIRFESGQRECHATFRLLQGTEHPVPFYVDLLLLRSVSGRIRVIDSRRFEGVDWLSGHMRVSFVPDENGLKLLNKFKAPSPADLEITKEREPLCNLIKVFGQKKYDRVLAYIERNTDDLKTSKLLHVLRIASGSYVDADKCAGFIAEAEKDFQGDGALRYVSAIAFERIGSWDDALAAWDRLDSTLGGDPYLHVVRARLHAASDRTDDARASALKATEAEPTLLEGWQARLGLEITRKNHGAAVELLKTMESRTVRMEDLKGLPSTEQFLASPEYQAWKDAPEK